MDTVAIAADWVASTVAMWAVSPWAFVALALVVMLGRSFQELLKNTEITKLIAGKMDVIDTIRADQVKSNKAREIQGNKINDLTERVLKIENEIHEIRCTRVNCGQRDG